MEEKEEIKGTGVYAPEVLEFVKSANGYCNWLEEAGQKRALEFIRHSIRHLSKVYHDVICIGYTEPLLEGGNEKFVTEQDWSSVYQKVMNLLGSHNEYLRVAEEEEYDRSEVVTHKISEDLADIYQDLKDFTMQYRQGLEEIMNDAVWEVMDNFENYWSKKLLNALWALNNLYVAKIDPLAELQPAEEPLEENIGESIDDSFFTSLQDLNEEDI